VAQPQREVLLVGPRGGLSPKKGREKKPAQGSPPVRKEKSHRNTWAGFTAAPWDKLPYSVQLERGEGEPTPCGGCGTRLPEQNDINAENQKERKKHI